MSDTTIPAETFQHFAEGARTQRPEVGTRVRVERGPHKGATGMVRHHMRDRFDDSDRYMPDWMRKARILEGREGFVVLVDTGATAAVWVKADRVTVL